MLFTVHHITGCDGCISSWKISRCGVFGSCFVMMIRTSELNVSGYPEIFSSISWFISFLFSSVSFFLLFFLPFSPLLFLCDGVIFVSASFDFLFLFALSKMGMGLEGGCHRPLLDLRKGKLEERANSGAHETRVTAASTETIACWQQAFSVLSFGFIFMIHKPRISLTRNENFQLPVFWFACVHSRTHQPTSVFCGGNMLRLLRCAKLRWAVRCCGVLWCTVVKTWRHASQSVKNCYSVMSCVAVWSRCGSVLLCV